jgi:flagellar biosynthesis/type III secretory pathway protein FliH
MRSLSETSETQVPFSDEPKPIIMKGVPIGAQAERLIKARREVSRVEELTRLEQIELEAQQKVDALIIEAKSKAEEIIAQAMKQADTIRREAREKGEIDAKKEALNRLDSLINTLDNEIKLLRSTRSEFLSQSLAGIIDFSCALAGRILVSELRSRPEAIAERACALIERMPPNVQLTLSVSPDDLEIIERYLSDCGGMANRITPSLRSDPSLSSGAMRIDSDSGMIDAGMMETLDSLGKLLMDQARDISGGKPNGV